MKILSSNTCFRNNVSCISRPHDSIKNIKKYILLWHLPICLERFWFVINGEFKTGIVSLYTPNKSRYFWTFEVFLFGLFSLYILLWNLKWINTNSSNNYELLCSYFCKIRGNLHPISRISMSIFQNVVLPNFWARFRLFLDVVWPIRLNT